jgi:hypothetical protein
MVAPRVEVCHEVVEVLAGVEIDDLVVWGHPYLCEDALVRCLNLVPVVVQPIEFIEF